MQTDRLPSSRIHAAALSGRVLTAILMFAIFATMTLMAFGFPEKARMMPLMAGVPGSLLALVSVLQELRRAMREAALSPPASRRGELAMLGWMLLYFIGILMFGFLYAAPVLVFVFLRFGKRESVATGAIGAAGTWAVLYGLFELVFQIPLFEGFAIAWLGR